MAVDWVFESFAAQRGGQQHSLAIRLTSEGKRKQGRPTNTWRRTFGSELRMMNLIWGQTSKIDRDRQRHIKGSYATWRETPGDDLYSA